MMKVDIVEEGLSPEEVLKNRLDFGDNRLEEDEQSLVWDLMKTMVREPMFLLLLSACVIYLVLGEIRESVIMLIALLVVYSISLFQEFRSKSAINALHKLAAPQARVLRKGLLLPIPVEEVVVNDLLLLQEGEVVAADGIILEARDLSLNESLLTGEAFPVQKYPHQHAAVYKGTLVTTGSARVRVSAVGRHTLFGKIGTSLKVITIVKTPLQKQISSFVKSMAGIGFVAFLIIVGVNYYQSGLLVHSLLHGLTLAMSIIPEEIPVAFSTFQALGAFRLLAKGIIVKQPQYVETLGSATVICADKTGTLTQNKMAVAFLYDVQSKASHPADSIQLPQQVVEYAMWACETDPFDPMELAIHEMYLQNHTQDQRSRFQQVHEYPLSGTPPIMTHIFQDQQGKAIIAVKGAPEGILRHARCSAEEVSQIEAQAIAYAQEGYRVLGVGKGHWNEQHWPASQEEFQFDFLGLIAFQDPPKLSIIESIKIFQEAGIAVKMMTGDYAATAVAIAKQVGLDHESAVMTGSEVLLLESRELCKKVGNVQIFARMFPEAKLKVIDALKENGEVVAMTGDGVNDAPALKAAHIGIAMGKRGSEVAKGAASLILTDDDLSHMTDAIAVGRRIYDNLKKAIRYIISIHIPIILVVVLPLLLGWTFTDFFYPVHVIFLELIMGPTCSIIYENEPMEPGTMLRKPRELKQTFLSFRQLVGSLLQGLVITAGCLGMAYWGMEQGWSEPTVRSLLFITLLFSNIFLTLVNRSFEHTTLTTLFYRNRLMPLVILITLLGVAAMLNCPFLRTIFLLAPLSRDQLLYALATAFVATFWMDLYKVLRRSFRKVHGPVEIPRNP